MRAIEKHKQELRDKYNSGISVVPFSWLYTSLIYAPYASPAHKKAADIMHSAAIRAGGPSSEGLDVILEAFEYHYEREPRLSVAALKIILAVAPDPTYKDYLAYKRGETNVCPPQYLAAFLPREEK